MASRRPKAKGKSGTTHGGYAQDHAGVHHSEQHGTVARRPPRPPKPLLQYNFAATKIQHAWWKLMRWRRLKGAARSLARAMTLPAKEPQRMSYQALLEEQCRSTAARISCGPEQDRATDGFQTLCECPSCGQHFDPSLLKWWGEAFECPGCLRLLLGSQIRRYTKNAGRSVFACEQCGGFFHVFRENGQHQAVPAEPWLVKVTSASASGSMT